MRANVLIVLLLVSGISSRDIVTSDHSEENHPTYAPGEKNGSREEINFLDKPDVCRNLTKEETELIAERMMECCDVRPLLETLPDNLKIEDALAKCEQVSSDEKTSSESDDLNNSISADSDENCIKECLLDHLGMLDDSRHINFEILKHSIISAFQGSILEGAIMRATELCMANPVLDLGGPEDCYSGDLDLGVCVGLQIFLTCPEQIWTTSETCTWLKTRYETCPEAVRAFYEDQ